MTANLETDVLVVGGGPAGTILAWQLAEKHSLNVVLSDEGVDKPWPNNYGVWVHEWEALERSLELGLTECLDYRWTYTDCFLGGEGSADVPVDYRKRINKPYARVNRAKLKERAMAGCKAAGVKLVRSNVGGVEGAVSHEPDSTTVTCDDGTVVRARLVVDATGSQSRLTKRVGEDNPGFQIAYGVMVDVDDHPFDEDAMLFMDYRTDWLHADSVKTSGQFGASRTVTRASVEAEPTFLYTMPMGEGAGGGRRVFFEETSLVARPPMEFDECKARLELRLAHLGVNVRSVIEEEFCFIPMGGALPSSHQRVLAIGGAAGTVHAATGYMMCRMLASSVFIAAEISASMRQAATAGASGFDADAAAARVYDALWPKENRLQRDFCVFGGEYLMRQRVDGLRGFFGGFFDLPDEQWTGFLAGWPGLPGNDEHDVWYKRLLFGIGLWLRVPPQVKLNLVLGAVQLGGLPFFRCVLPILQDTTLEEAPATL